MREVSRRRYLRRYTAAPLLNNVTDLRSLEPQGLSCKMVHSKKRHLKADSNKLKQVLKPVLDVPHAG